MSHMYVDVAGAHDLSNVAQILCEVDEVLKTTGFSLRKRTINDTSLLRNDLKDYLLGEEFIDLSDNSKMKTLGLNWNIAYDYFYIKSASVSNKTAFTKRQALPDIPKTFDPAGWLARKAIVAKIIMLII